MKKFFTYILTGIDNTSFDISRVLIFQCMQAYLCFTAYALYKGMQWNYLDFATGVAALLTAGSASIAMKSKTEPQPCNREHVGERDQDFDLNRDPDKNRDTDRKI